MRTVKARGTAEMVSVHGSLKIVRIFNMIVWESPSTPNSEWPFSLHYRRRTFALLVYLLQSGILSSLSSDRKRLPVRLCSSILDDRWIGLSSKTQHALTQMKSICIHANIETPGSWRLKNYYYFGFCRHAKKPDAICL